MKAFDVHGQVTEAAYQNSILCLAATLRLLAYHTYDSRRSQGGFPDLVVVGTRCIFVEVKKETGVVSAKQKEWHARLLRAGEEVYVWRPSDWATVEAVLKELAQ